MGLDAPEKYQESDDFEFWLDNFGLDICAMGATHGCQFVYFCGCSGTHNGSNGHPQWFLGTHKDYQGTHNGFAAWAPTRVLIIVK